MIMSELDSYLADRRSLLAGLLDAVKQCQIRFGGRTELATDSDSRVTCLCNRLEAVFNHGMKINNKGLLAIKQVTEKVTGLNLRNSFDSDVFWHFVKEFLNRHEYDRYMLLKHITTDSGRGRAWLRSALNERSLEKYMHMMLADPSFIAQYYEDWSFLLDQERSSMLPMMSAGLGSILFAINIDDNNLNSPSRSTAPAISSSPVENVSTFPEPMPVITARESSHEIKKKGKKKRGQDKIVSFDDDDHVETDIMETSSLTASVVLSDASELSGDQSQSNVESANPSIQPSVPETVVNQSPYDFKLNNPVNMKVNNSQDGGISDLSGEISLTSSASEDSSRSSVDRVVPTNLPCNIFEKSDAMPRRLSSQSLSTQSSADAAVNYSEETTITTLTPVTDTSVELILVSDDEQQSQSEDSVSIPSFTEDTDHAAQALALTQKAVLSSNSHVDANGIMKNNNLMIGDTRSRSESISKLSGSDLSQVVYSLLQKQDEITEQNRSLRHLLDQEMEMSSSLRLQVDELIKTNNDKIEKEKSQIQALSRENEVLKHQLKKYVGAVQMLKRDTLQAHEVLSSSSDPQLILSSQMTPYVNYASEAMEYEKKLIQVAEMHGELMEFNERLHRMVIYKENTIKRLRNELVDLRGPLPDNGHLSDEDVLSDTSENDTSSLSPSTRALINIWIPSAFLTGRSNDTHHVYQVFIRIKDIEWNIYRRYSHFNILHQALRKKHKIVNTFNFPPKKAIGNRDAKLVEDRRQKLQHYLRCVVNFVVQNTTELSNSPNKETLIKLMPFFGEIPMESKKSKSRRKPPAFPASSSSTHSDHNLYTGL